MRKFTVIDVEQRSADWFAARLGRVTSSRVSDMLALRRDKKEAAARRNLRVQLALERLTGKAQERDFQSLAMLQGIEREGEALAVYEALTGQFVNRVGFLRHDGLMVGASLDGYLGDFEGIVEAKCPLPATHLEYLQTGIVPADYLDQVRHQLFVSGAAWCDWFSYQPDFPEPLQTKLLRIARDEAVLTAHELSLRLFLSEVDREVELIEGLAVAAV